MIIYLAIYVLFCIILARLNSEWIEDGLKINHKLNGAAHLCFAIGALFFDWWHFLTILFTGRVAFDISLNHFRELPIGYVSPSPLSKVDIIEKKVFGNNGILPKAIYVVIIAFFLFSCTSPKEIQVQREVVELINVERRDEKTAVLSWQTQSGEIFTEFTEWPCYMTLGTRFIILIRK